MIEIRTVVAWGGSGCGLTVEGTRELSRVTVLYLDWGGGYRGYICQNSLNYTLQNLYIVLFVQLTLNVKPPQYWSWSFSAFQWAAVCQLRTRGDVVMPAAVVTWQLPSYWPGGPACGLLLIQTLCWPLENSHLSWTLSGPLKMLILLHFSTSSHLPFSVFSPGEFLAFPSMLPWTWFPDHPSLTCPSPGHVPAAQESS